jgi:hypothetical protein
MGGLAKFLFGGIVGALIGVFVAPKRAQKVREALLGGMAGDNRYLPSAAPGEVVSAPVFEVPVSEIPVAEAYAPEARVEFPALAEEESRPPQPPIPPAPPEEVRAETVAAEEPAAEEVPVAEPPAALAFTPSVLDEEAPEAATPAEATEADIPEAALEIGAPEQPPLVGTPEEEPAVAPVGPEPEPLAVPEFAEGADEVLESQQAWTAAEPVAPAGPEALNEQPVWEPAATPMEPVAEPEPAAEEATLEEPAPQEEAPEGEPATLEEAPVLESPVLQAMDPDGPVTWETAWSAEIADSSEELEAVSEEAVGEGLEAVSEEAAAEASDAISEEAAAEAEAEELPAVAPEPAQVDLLAEATVESEPLLPETPEAEAVSGAPEAEAVSEAPQPDQYVPAPREPAHTPADLKARIEETRRRIRRELAHPFSEEAPDDAYGGVPAGDKPAFGGTPTYQEQPLEPEAPVDEAVELAHPVLPEETAAVQEAVFQEPEPEPVVEAAPEPEPVLEYEPVEPAISEAPGQVPVLETFEDLAPPLPEEPLSAPQVAEEPETSGASDLVAEPESAGDEEQESAPQLVASLPAGGFDHDAMRRRIEETRNRLKAKAFDAMMSGEGALLRESKAETPESATLTVDSDVDETIETALTEEEF